jgi:predicted nuclease with TOPRIM domain
MKKETDQSKMQELSVYLDELLAERYSLDAKIQELHGKIKAIRQLMAGLKEKSRLAAERGALEKCIELGEEIEGMMNEGIAYKTIQKELNISAYIFTKARRAYMWRHGRRIRQERQESENAMLISDLGTVSG